jgi:hypothetical protein
MIVAEKKRKKSQTVHKSHSFVTAHTHTQIPHTHTHTQIAIYIIFEKGEKCSSISIHDASFKSNEVPRRIGNVQNYEARRGADLGRAGSALTRCRCRPCSRTRRGGCGSSSWRRVRGDERGEVGRGGGRLVDVGRRSLGCGFRLWGLRRMRRCGFGLGERDWRR